MIFELTKLEQELWVAGLSQKTDPKHLYEDLPALSKRYAGLRPSIKNQIRPLTTCVASKEDKIFMGDFVERKDSKLESFCLKKGQLLVKVKVPVHMQALLPAKVARLRKKFYQEWLVQSSYQSSAQWQDLEVYHYRRRYFRKSRKMVMELWFLLEKKED